MIAPGHATALLATVLEPGERVIWAARPDLWTTIRNKAFLWWIGVPWCIGVIGLSLAGRGSPIVAAPLALVGFALMATPILLAIDTQYTLYAVTDRRALILRNGLLKPGLVSCAFDRMDEVLEVMTSGGKSGHLYFASNMPTKMRDVDYTGKLAFRDLADVQEASLNLERARKEALPAKAV